MTFSKISSIFSQFNKEISYVYLRDSAHLNNIISQKIPLEDLDILIERKDVNKTIEILKKNHYISLKKITSHCRDIFLYNTADPTYPHFNIHVDSLVKMSYLKGRQILKHKKKEKNIFIIGDSYKLLILLLKDLFLNGFFSVKKYSLSKQKEIHQLYAIKKNKSFLTKTLRKLIGNKETTRLMKYIEKREFKKITSQRRTLQQSILFRNPLFLKHFIHNTYHYLKGYISRKPLFVSFLGVDGSGKTTTITKTKEFLDIAHHSSQIIYLGRWAQFILPIHLFNTNKKHKKITLSMNEVHQQHKKKNGLFYFNIFLRDIFYITEYTLKYLVKILPKRILRKNIICDRYVYDLLLMKDKTIFLKWFVWLYPKPKKTFILYNTPSVIWKRKKELTVKELQRQQDILLALKSKKVHTIKTITPSQTSTIVLKKFHEIF